MHFAPRLFLLIAFSLIVSVLMAGGPVTWTFEAIPAQGDTMEVRLNATCETGWHIYALTLPSNQGPLPTVIQVENGAGYQVVGGPVEPEPIEENDPNFGMIVRYHGGTATFIQPVQRNSAGTFTIHGSVEYMACNDMTCLPPTTVEFTLDIPSR